MCHDPKKILDPGSPGSRIRDLGGSWILNFHFSRGILGILDLVAAPLSWDPRDPESQVEEMSLDPGDPRSCLGRLLWDLADLESCTIIMLLNLLCIQ